MEVRLLTKQEIPQALMTARGVFHYQVRANIADERLADSFDEYTQEESVLRMMEENRLLLWGIYADGQICAMSGMQTEGHITMLYVLPFYQRRGMGTALVKEMKQYAAGTLRLKGITVNAMPAWVSGYFERFGFQRMNPSQQMNEPFVSMHAKITPEVLYTVRRVPSPVVIGLLSGYLVFAAVAVVAFFVICG